jgi:pyridoxine/pyridoxamine 5'-phosphate oxidase
MTATPRTAHNIDGYGSQEIDWAAVVDVLDGSQTQAPGTGGPNRHTSWLTTIDPDGRPHVRPVGTVTVAGTRYFNSGLRTRKSRNLARDPRASLSIATEPFDLVVEGRAERVADPSVVAEAVSAFRAGGWPCEQDGDAITAPFSAQTAGPPPWYLYRIVPETVYVIGTAEPYGAMKFEL